MNGSGKVVTIFVIITAILLLSLTAISVFFFQQEYQKRKSFEDALGESQSKITQLTQQITDTEKQRFLLEEKNKELDERLNSLLDELELERGLKEEIQREQVLLNEKLDKEIKAREKAKTEMTQRIEEAQTKIFDLEKKLREEVETARSLMERNKLLESENLQLAKGLGIDDYTPSGTTQGGDPQQTVAATAGAQELGDIVIASSGANGQSNATTRPSDGRIISVDDETEFVIIDLGKKHGMTLGRILSVYRGDKYLGDIKVTRVQPEMSAADLILPLTGKLVMKNDQVLAK
jgi:hypothetical protein